MKTFRRFSLLATIFFVFTFVLSAQTEKPVIETNYPQPVFEKSSAFVIDVFEGKGKFSSYVQITNYSQYASIKFEVYVHSPLTSSWESLGTQELRGFDDDVDFGKKYPDLGAYRYFAIVPINSGNNEYQYKIEKKLGRLDVSIWDAGADVNAQPLPFYNSPTAYVFTSKLIPNGAKENVSLENMTPKELISISVLGWDKKNYKWIKLYGISAHPNQKRPTAYEISDKKLHYKHFKYFAIVSSDNTKYDYTFKVNHDDWTIVAEDALP